MKRLTSRLGAVLLVLVLPLGMAACATNGRVQHLEDQLNEWAHNSLHPWQIETTRLICEIEDKTKLKDNENWSQQMEDYCKDWRASTDPPTNPEEPPEFGGG